MHDELSGAFLETHVPEAAVALENTSVQKAAAVLAAAPTSVGAEVLAAMSPDFAIAVCDELEEGPRRELLAAQPIPVAVGLLRRMSPELRDATVESLPDDASAAVRPLLRYTENTVGALMDPGVLGLFGELAVGDALERIRKASARVLYNVYVLDRDNLLIGVTNLQELLAADPKERLIDMMRPATHRLHASTPARAVPEHPGWQTVYSLPVVDDDGCYLGAIRYGVLRRLERETAAERSPDAASPTARALGEVFGLGVSGLIEALGGTFASAPRDRGGHR